VYAFPLRLRCGILRVARSPYQGGIACRNAHDLAIMWRDRLAGDLIASMRMLACDVLFNATLQPPQGCR